MKAECDSCGYKTELSEYGHVNSKRMLCEVCAATFISRITEITSYSGEIKMLAQSIAVATNMILDAIKKGPDRRGGTTNHPLMRL